MATLNGVDTDDIEISIEDAERALYTACDALRKAVRLADKAGLARLAGEIEGYTLGNIYAFLDGDEHQPGSVGSLRNGLRDDVREAQEEGSES